ncbi:MAG: Flp pilus assembly complex ATPase component TadA [Candidatus Cloacimonetes bacterium]|nr:Flp pilus assembly complex ATPase component TadA [Candidatus Cloacimonadota bacterium]
MSFIKQFKQQLKECNGKFTDPVSFLVMQNTETLTSLKEEDFVFLLTVTKKLKTKNVDQGILKQAIYKLDMIQKQSGSRRVAIESTLDDEDFSPILELAKSRNAEVIHIRTNKRPLFRIAGVLMEVEEDLSISASQLQKMIANTFSSVQYNQFQTMKSVSFSLSLAGVSRFRVHAFYENDNIRLVFKQVPLQIPELSTAKLDPKLLDLLQHNQDLSGLVLINGPSRSGKSTSCAVLLEWINQNLPRKVFCLEDPIEYLFRDNKSSVTQREKYSDFEDLSKVIQYSLKDGVEILYVTKIDSLETLEIVLTAAETGVLVISTVTAIDVVRSIESLFFGADKTVKFGYQQRLSRVLLYVSAQILVPRREGGKALVKEQVMMDSSTKGMVREGQFKVLSNLIDQTKNAKIFSFHADFEDLIKQSELEWNEVMDLIPDYESFEKKMRSQGLI